MSKLKFLAANKACAEVVPPTLRGQNISSRSRATRTLFVALVASMPRGSASSLPYPPLSVVERSLLTTAHDAFNGHAKGFEAAAQWSGERLGVSEGNARAPHLVCTEYSRGRETISHLQDFLSPEAVRPAAHSSAHGACFFVTASHAEARAMSSNPRLGLLSIAPFPSALKVSPGVLEHGDGNRDRASQGPAKLATIHGQSMRMSNVEGLNLELSPGTLPAHSHQADAFIAQLLNGLMSGSINLHATNVWSDPGVANGDHLTTPGGSLRKKEWSTAAALVHDLSTSGRTTPGDICSWGSISMHHAANDVVLVSGLDHLLYTGGGEAGSDDESTELRVACLMGLVSFLSSRVEVLRVSPRHRARLLNAAARTLIQSATLTEAPLTAAGLDGTGQIIQVIDTGVDETSCFFIDGDGEEVTHGHYYEELGETTPPPVVSSSLYSWTYVTAWSSVTSSNPWLLSTSSTSSSSSSSISETTSPAWSPSSGSFTPSPTTATISIFEGGDFSSYPERRKIIQYINMVKTDSVPGSDGSFFTTSLGNYVAPWLPGFYFENDDVGGHGTHTAGSAAGATLNTPAETVTCSEPKELGCAGGCIDPDVLAFSDDLDPSSYWSPTYFAGDIDRICPAFGCDSTTESWCLSDDVSQTLSDNGGMAQGAKLAIFDVFAGQYAYEDKPGNGLWEPCLEAGCKIHSASLGADVMCGLRSLDIVYDDFMYKNPENLLVFAAGNDGDVEDGRTVCTMNSPAIGKNALAVGATSAGETRLTSTGEGGKAANGTNGYADVDTVASFSSYGLTQDGRIKPEVVAPGDSIYSASSDATDIHSCRLRAFSGTSMSTPIVAGASAMVRQYFVDESFYIADVAARGWCSEDASECEAFSPSSATVKALLINSANLMGGSAEPDGYRGFGRIHLEMGMPLGGEGSLALFVADSADFSLPEFSAQEFVFDVDAEAGLDFRATLSWIDPPATTIAVNQLVHDLDLDVTAPSGATHVMWATSGKVDTSNVNERVIIDAADVESGTWTVRVSTKGLLTESQSYSLVVNGAIGIPSAESFRSSSPSSAGSIAFTPMSLMALLVVSAMASIFDAACAA